MRRPPLSHVFVMIKPQRRAAALATDRGTGYLEESPVRCGKGEEVGDEAAAAAMAAMAAPPSTSFTSSASF